MSAPEEDYQYEDQRDEQDWGDDETRCCTCGGSGMVESMLEELQRFGWDEDKPGTCPNCGGSGFRKDCTYF